MSQRMTGFLLVAPALAIVLFLFIVPLFGSITGAFHVGEDWGFGNFTKAFELYSSDMLFTVVIVTLSSALIALFPSLLADI